MTASTDRHDSCKFGMYIQMGTHASKSDPRGCDNSHCTRLVKRNQCLVCEWYSKRMEVKE
jgi:hypothetical protein